MSSVDCAGTVSVVDTIDSTVTFGGCGEIESGGKVANCGVARFEDFSDDAASSFAISISHKLGDAV